MSSHHKCQIFLYSADIKGFSTKGDSFHYWYTALWEDATCFREQHLFIAAASRLSSMPAPPCDAKQNLFKLFDFLLRLLQYKKKQKNKKTKSTGGEKKKMGGVMEVLKIEILSAIFMFVVLCGCNQTASHSFVPIALPVNWKLNIFLSASFLEINGCCKSSDNFTEFMGFHIVCELSIKQASKKKNNSFFCSQFVYR